MGSSFLRKTFGVYQIKNLVNNKIYVGSTSQSFYQRWYNWRRDLNGERTGNLYLLRSWQTHGEDSFEFSILETIDPIEGEATEDKKILVLEREQYWMDLLKPEYNLCPTAGSRLGSKQSEETRSKISAAMSRPEIKDGLKERVAALPAEEREIIYARRRGKSIHSETHKQLLSEAANDRLNSPDAIAKRAATKTGHKRTEEQRQKMREAQANKRQMTDGEKAAWKANISIALKASGHRPPSTKGKVMSAAQKQKISASNTGRPKVRSS
jgi:group I intron endonuclease